MPLLSSGEFAARSRLSPKALRLYAERDLLTPASVDPATGYRLYGDAELERARRIALLRAIGMPLAQIAEVLALSGAEAAEAVDTYWRSVEVGHAARRPLVSHLRRVLTGEGVPALVDIHERSVPAQKVIFIQAHVTAPDLPRFLPDATAELFAHLTEARGTLTGPVFVAYHGLVSEDSDGPVEVCVPTDAAIEPAGRVGVRVEAAHREAYLELTKAQAAYPAILSAYDTLASWLAGEGRTPAASAREVYYPNWDGAAPDEHCVDVAFPYRSLS